MRVLSVVAAANAPVILFIKLTVCRQPIQMTPNPKLFPVFNRFEVFDYGIYPGRSEASSGLRIDFHPGLTLVVGANGLGKTTLVTLLFRLLTGPYDIPRPRTGTELRFSRLDAKKIPTRQRKVFASRVSDGASNATARLTYMLGSTSVTVERRVSDLSLRSARVGEDQCRNDLEYQERVVSVAGLGSFGDFILMLRYLVFYFEDRRQLVWDVSAQRQLLRMLFLPPDIAQEWSIRERSIIKNDSNVRNYQTVVGRVETDFSRSLAKTNDAVSLRAELQDLEEKQEPDRIRLEEMQASTSSLDQYRQEARLKNLNVEQNRESKYRALERAKLLALDARFPGDLEAGRFMLAHLLTEKCCLVCGSDATDAAQLFASRLASDRCIVCNNQFLTTDNIVEAREVADARVIQANLHLEAAERELVASERDREKAEADFEKHIKTTAELKEAIATRSHRLEQILESLPPSEAELHEKRVELSTIRTRLEALKSELADERRAFGDFVQECTKALVSSSDSIVETFKELAGNFLSEEILLTWKPRSATVGTGGIAIPFPAFELNMAGSDFVEMVRRTGPDDVSESQREFIDLSFRMALMKAAGRDAVGIVIDAPESSLDAVFAKRAGETLIRFGEVRGNKVIITSNLIEGNLLPTLIEGIVVTPEKRERLVDLFEHAQPTAAVRSERIAYDELRCKLFESLS